MEDVIIVGAGPAGSSAAFALAKKGHRVTVLEEHPKVGDPENCAGLIGAEVISSYDLPRRSILRGFTSVSLYSPTGRRAGFRFHRLMAYVVQRGEFDRDLARRAESVGATYLTGVRCTDIRILPDCARLWVRASDASSREGFPLSTRAVVLATGVRSGLQKITGLSPPAVYMEAAHLVTRVRDVAEIEVFLGRNWAPGYFAWLLPLDNDYARIGVCAERHAVPYLKRFLTHPMVSRRLLGKNNHRIMAKLIPVSTAPNSYTSRLLLVGDAAGQVKPTTGGGISCGIVCGHIAGATLANALREDDLSQVALRAYEVAWHRVMASEFETARSFRTLFSMLPDRNLDELVTLLAKKHVRRMIEFYGNFDRHSRVIRQLARLRDVSRLLGLPFSRFPFSETA